MSGDSLRRRLTGVILCIAVGFAAQAEEKDIIATAKSAGDFQSLLDALSKAGLAERLQGDEPFTLFAPNDKAFAKLPQEAVDALQNDPKKLKTLLSYHIVPGRVRAAAFAESAQLKTLEGKSLKIAGDGSTRKIDRANIVKADILCRNGVIHVIDAVLLPSDFKP